MKNQALRLAPLLLATVLAAPAWSAQPGNILPLYVGKPMDGVRIMFGDWDVQKPLEGTSGRMDDDPKLPDAVVELKKSARHGADDALNLTWKNAWFATVRTDSAALDLRPYLAKGVVSFDLKVNELANGGLSFRLDCGPNCERKIPYVKPARAAQGKGWKTLTYALKCFYHKGDDFSGVNQPFALDGTGAGDVEVANLRIQKQGKPNAACPDYRTISVTPAPLEESWSLGWWMPRHQEKLAEIKRRRAAGEPTGLVFIGDSITHGWEKEGKATWDRLYRPHGALNLGYGGDRTENVLWRLQHGEVDGIAPKVAVLMFGTNNTGHRHEDPALTLAGIKRNLAELNKRLPRTKILLLAVFPRDEKPDGKLRQINDKLNQMLPRLADGKKVFFLNINQAFLQPDGTLSKDIMPDLLHPNEKGYEIWAEAMQPELERLMR
jgi:beta-glucosidase